MTSRIVAAIGLALLSTGYVLDGHAQGMGMSAADSALVAREKEAWDAFAKKDVARFNRVLAGDAILSIDPNGIGTFDPTMMNQCEVRRWALGDMKVTHVTADVALLTYSATVDGTCMGDPIPPKVYASSIWVRRGDRWVGHFHQETVAAPPSEKEMDE